MFNSFFEKNPPIKSETADKKSIDKIKAAVLKGIRENPDETDFNIYGESEVTPMKKRNIARTFIIAAAAAALGASSLVSANAITESPANECVSDKKITDGKTEVYNIFTIHENSIFAIDENGEEHLIAGDQVVWAEYDNESFDFFVNLIPVQTEMLENYFGSYEMHSPEEILKGADSYTPDEAPINSENIKLPNIYTDSGDCESKI